MKTFFLGLSILLLTSSVTLAKQVPPVSVPKISVQEMEKLRKASLAYKDKVNTLKDVNLLRKAMSSGGAMDGGGGQGVILKDGRVLLVDTLPRTFSDQNAIGPSERRRILYARNQVVKNRARDFKNFFACGKVKLQNQPYEVLHNLSHHVDDLHPLAVEFRLTNLSRENLPPDFQSLIENTPVFATPSAAIAEDLQEPVASYQRSRLWISSRMYERMNPSDQCALQVHESLRHLNRVLKLSSSLSTSEIETVTRYIVGISKEEPESLRRLEAEFLLSTPKAFESMQKEVDSLLLEVKTLKDNAVSYTHLTLPTKA